LTFGYDPAGGLQVDNFLPEPVGPEDADDQRDYLSDLLFPPLDSPRIAAILRQPIAGSTWQQDLDRATKYASGEQIANVMASGLSLGKNPREVAKELQSRLGVVQSSARRVARTYGVQVAHRAQMDCHQALGGLLVGYQIRATLDQHTRPWHAARSGTIYYLDPAPGQKGMAQCPHPPLEAEDPNERPPGTPRTAWACRCYLAPVLRGDDAIQNHPDFTTATGALVTAPDVYSDWFANADEPRRRLAVGTRRYSLLKNTLGAHPSWEHFLDTDGSLLSVDSLATETDQQRADRLAKVRAALAHRRTLTRQVRQYGFVPGEVGKAAAVPATPPDKLPARTGLLPDGQRVRFARHPNATRDEIIVMVDPRKLDAAWSADAMYLPPGGIGATGIPGRREAFTSFLATGKAVQASRVSLDDSGVPAFTDGRHRFAVLRDTGANLVGIMVPKDQADDVRRRFGAAPDAPAAAP